MNLTDVDDKIIKKSNNEDTEAKNVAEKYTAAFMEDIAKLKVKKADVYPKATEHMRGYYKYCKRTWKTME